MVLVLRTRSYLRVPSTHTDTHRRTQTHTDTHRESIIKICALLCIAFSLEHTRIRYCVSPSVPSCPPRPPPVNYQIASENLFRQLPFTDNSRVQWFPWNHLKFTSALSALSVPSALPLPSADQPPQNPKSLLCTPTLRAKGPFHMYTHTDTHTHTRRRELGDPGPETTQQDYKKTVTQGHVTPTRLTCPNI